MGEEFNMAKAKLNPALNMGQKGFAQHGKCPDPRLNQSFTFRRVRTNIVLQRKNWQKRKPSKKLSIQQYLYSGCDALYHTIAFYYPRILLEWFLSLNKKEREGLTVYQVFMRRCLKRDLADFLRNYLLIDLMPLEVSFEEDNILIKAQLDLKFYSEERESFYEPRIRK